MLKYSQTLASSGIGGPSGSSMQVVPGVVAHRRRLRQRGARHAGHGGGRVEQAAEQLRPRRRRIALARHARRRRRGAASRSKPDRASRATQRCGGRGLPPTSEHERQRHLHDDEQLPEAEEAVAGDAAALGLQRVVRLERACRAWRGRVPKSTAVAIVTAAVNPRIRQSSDRARNTVFVGVDSCRTSSRLPHCASSRPSERAGAGEQQAFGQELPRDPQRARRRARCAGVSSWRRAAARASSRLARFAQAISRTRPTTTMIVVSGRR